MKIKHLRTVSDGFCFNHHWPMWSQNLEFRANKKRTRVRFLVY